MPSLIQFSSLECPRTIKTFLTYAKAESTISLRRNFIPCAKPHHRQSAKQLDGGKIESRRKDEWRAWCQDWSCGIPPPDATPSLDDVVNQFYGIINEKDKRKLEDIIYDDCHFEEFIFYLPFDTKERILKFFEDLMDAMGPNVKFHTETITQVGTYTAIAVWHLGVQALIENPKKYSSSHGISRLNSLSFAKNASKTHKFN